MWTVMIEMNAFTRLLWRRFFLAMTLNIVESLSLNQCLYRPQVHHCLGSNHMALIKLMMILPCRQVSRDSDTQEQTAISFIN